ncbi:LytTR family transcriptional regulator DNA-binding domain-containing protein [Amycolatopsis sp. OK19-0408]|uniref:LytTR family transcriptional regulator DNA-binding domain-containing protein n=1 Tax=Amycolatopsis iheyensis TaxID=2945988 RepID=A0A9X2NIS4_9PSEU|nr:DNA-binding protein [Amycolatopsis iheyensis]MCR6489571.1 LytTR family transcriptional regulator DNA-binding domain-containing protein [Amycolatopsis iheyensis]
MLDAQRTATSPGGAAVFEAWERFVRGEDQVPGVRPVVAISWHRCREQYRVDPHLTEAPVAAGGRDHGPEHDVVFAELGFRAASVAHEMGNLRGVVSVTDAAGRILGEWGDPATLTRATDFNLAPWFCWSECAAGTNGMGTALEAHGPVLISGAEHWCQAFHSWVSAGIAVRDVVTGEPIAGLNLSCWRNRLPPSAGGWLANAVAKTQRALKRRARDSGAELVAAYTQAGARSAAPLAAVDTAGKAVIADDTASVLMGVPAATPAIDATLRWTPGLPELITAARHASEQATRNPGWVGSTRIFTHLADEPTAISFRPVFSSAHLIGHLVSFGVAEGAQLPPSDAPRARPRRLVGLRDNRMVLLGLPEVSLAESDGNDVWLSTARGRLRAASPSLDKLDAELADAGFLRVHRRYVVNLGRVQEIERGPKGELSLVMADGPGEPVPVSRRNAPAVRRALNI